MWATKLSGFHVRKWVSNLTEVLADVPEEDRASEVDLEKNRLPVTKTLFKYSPPSTDLEYTKRNVLKKTATLFDPLGFLSPFVVKAKLLMQQTWLQALEWDEVLPPNQKEQWESWLSELPLLEEIKIPRCLKDGSKHVTLTQSACTHSPTPLRKPTLRPCTVDNSTKMGRSLSGS